MITQRERYYNDPVFHTLVDTMVAAIMNSNFTPSEMRDAALLASIKYEELRVRPPFAYPKEVIDWLDSVPDPYIEGPRREEREESFVKEEGGKS